MSAAAKRVLVAEDDKECSSLLKDFLGDLGYKVTVVGDGATLYRIASDIMPDIIISDLDMPGLSGGTAQTLLRSSEKTRRIPIIFVTGFQDEYRSEIRTISNVSLFSKPFDTAALLEVVEAELAMRGVSLPLEP